MIHVPKYPLTLLVRPALILWIGWVLCACNPGTQSTGFVNPDPNLYDTSWLTAKLCAAPCWNGLEPGITTRADSIDSAKKLPFIISDSVFLNKAYGVDIASFMCKEPPDFGCVSLLFDQGVLESVSITPGYEITFSQAVEHLGAPDGFLVQPVYPDARGCRLQIVWKKRGLILANTEGVVGLFDFRDDLCTQVSNNHDKLPPLLLIESVTITDSVGLKSMLENDTLETWQGFAQN